MTPLTDKHTARKHVKFASFDDLLAFLYLCETRSLISDRDHYQRIYLDNGPTFAVAYHEEKGADVERHAALLGGRCQDLEPSGKTIHINDLLLQVGIRQQAIVPSHFGEMVLACDSRISHACERLYAAWNQVPKKAETESIFRIIPDSGSSWLAVEMPAIRPEFDFEEFRTRMPEGVRAFLPAWSGDERCFLFVEAGYQYPLPREFFFLYDETYLDSGVATGEAEQFEHIVLLQKGRKHGESDDGYTWWEPECHLIGGSFTRSNRIYVLNIEGVEVVRRISEAREFDAAQSLPVKLGLNVISESLGSAHAIESRIGQHEKALEELHRRRARLRELIEQEYLPIFVFVQPGDQEALPSQLDRFLQRPLGELAHYSYLRTVDENGGYRHIVIGEIPVSSSQALMMPVSTTYLCRKQWDEERLPLYVRADTCLSYPVEEAGLIRELHRYLGEIPGLGDFDGSYVLAEPTGRKSGGIKFELLCPPGSRVQPRPLDEMFFFTNQLNGGPDSIATTANIDLNVETRQREVELDEKTREFDRELITIAASRVNQTEQQWEQLRQKTQELLLDMRMGDIALEVTKSAYTEIPDSWSGFLEEIRRVDGEVSRLKLDAMAEWERAGAERQAMLDQLAVVLTEVATEVSSKELAFTARLAEQREECARLAEAIPALSELRNLAQEEFRKCCRLSVRAARDSRQIRIHLAELERQDEKCRKRIASYVSGLKKHEEKIACIEKLDADCRTANENTTQKLHECVAKEAGLSNLREEFKAREEALRKKEEELERMKGRLDQLAKSIATQATRAINSSYCRKKVVRRRESEILGLLQGCVERLRMLALEKESVNTVESQIKALIPEGFEFEALDSPQRPSILRRIWLFFGGRP